MIYGQIIGKYSMLWNRMPLLDHGIYEHSGSILSCFLLLLESDEIGEGLRLGMGCGTALYKRGNFVLPHLHLYSAHNNFYCDDANGDHGYCVAVRRRQHGR